MVLVLVGAFYVALSLVQTLNLIDPISFESHLNYFAKAESLSPSHAVKVAAFSRLRQADVYQSSIGPRAVLRESDLRVSSEVWTWEESNRNQVIELFSGSLVAGEIAKSGALVDATVAEKLNLQIGAEFYVQFVQGYSVKNCKIVVSGLTRTYRNIKEQGSPGLVVAGSAACPVAWQEGQLNSDWITYSFSNSDSTNGTFISKPQVIREIWDANSTLTNQTLFLMIYCLSIGFWILAVTRVYAGIVVRTKSARKTLYRVGANWKKINRATLSLVLAGILLASPASTMLALVVLKAGPRFAIGTDNIFSVLLLQAISSFITLIFLVRHYSKSMKEI
jgi:hypothetical protein